MNLTLPAPDVCECGGPSSVIDVRVRTGSHAGVRSGWLFRRRECLRCGARWSTWESALLHPKRLRRFLASRIDDPNGLLLSLVDPMTAAPSRGEG